MADQTRPSATLRQVGWIDQNGWLHPLTKADPEDGWVSVYVIENDPHEPRPAAGSPHICAVCDSDIRIAHNDQEADHD